MTNPLTPGQLTGARALITGSSRGIGAKTAEYLADAGASVVINYRNKEARAQKLAESIEASGGTAIAVGADLTDPVGVARMMGSIKERWGGLDLLILNASGGMEADMGEDYAMKLNRDAQVGLLMSALPLMERGARVVFVTSHQAHFIREVETMPEYVPVALSKRAGEDALRGMNDQMKSLGIDFVVVSGDMIEGTVTATLLNRANPGVIDQRKEQVGKLYNVDEFAAEVALAAVEDIPDDHTRLVGDISSFQTS
ncbi:MAG: SDR family oxidoreductase [Pontimonas sp.]|jgi:NAD(P)-dependent dehydrogenase (short-subunit alcohol dehydrogenase family)|nr:SDR family oxidoreductase [Pontimonas sp.]MDP4817151.1 SDR family oxidoreductase [Pontimonas sp.]MDP4899477.1 SDR family oxidoreductase [Pontimonas sp.]